MVSQNLTNWRIRFQCNYKIIAFKKQCAQDAAKDKRRRVLLKYIVAAEAAKSMRSKAQ